MQSPKAGSMFARNILALGLYTFFFRLSNLMAPSHEYLLRSNPGLLYRWHCWVRLSHHLPVPELGSMWSRMSIGQGTVRLSCKSYQFLNHDNM